MNETYQPLIIDSVNFTEHYGRKGLSEIIHGLSWVTECFGIIDQLKRTPDKEALWERLSKVVIPELRKEPLGEKAHTQLDEIAALITTDRQKAKERIDGQLEMVLKDLSAGYRMLLKRIASIK